MICSTKCLSGMLSKNISWHQVQRPSKQLGNRFLGQNWQVFLGETQTTCFFWWLHVFLADCTVPISDMVLQAIASAKGRIKGTNVFKQNRFKGFRRIGIVWFSFILWGWVLIITFNGRWSSYFCYLLMSNHECMTRIQILSHIPFTVRYRKGDHRIIYSLQFHPSVGGEVTCLALDWQSGTAARGGFWRITVKIVYLLWFVIYISILEASVCLIFSHGINQSLRMIFTFFNVRQEKSKWANNLWLWFCFLLNSHTW